MKKTNDFNDSNREKLTPLPTTNFSENEQIRQSLIEGNKILAEEEKNGTKKIAAPSVAKKKTVTAGATNPDIYTKAKAIVLAKWKKDTATSWRAIIIENLDKEPTPVNRIKDRLYQTFVQEVIEQAEKS